MTGRAKFGLDEAEGYVISFILTLTHFCKHGMSMYSVLLEDPEHWQGHEIKQFFQSAKEV